MLLVNFLKIQIAHNKSYHIYPLYMPYTIHNEWMFIVKDVVYKYRMC